MKDWFRALVRCWALRRQGTVPPWNPGGAVAVLTALWLALWVGIDWWERQPEPVFAPEGVPLLAWYALGVLGLAWVLRAWSGPATRFASTLVLAMGLVPVPLALVTVSGWVEPRWYVALAVVAVLYGWLYLARGLRAASGVSQHRAALLGVVFVAAFVVASDRTNAIPDVWNPADSSESVSDQDIAEREIALFEQADRIDQALEDVKRDDSPRARSFFVGFAGVGDQKVFAQEIGLASHVIGERYQTGERQVALVNDERDLNAAPLASVSGLNHALRGIADRMQLDRDVLFLAISSHGSPDPAIAVSNSQFPMSDLRPEDLVEALRDSGIRWRVIVISACYAGGFIAPLRDPQTIIITAAAPDRTSFGCSNDSDLTYFGEAFYRDAIPQARSLRDAFEKAKAAIAEREQAEGEEPSDPQAYFGAALEAHLTALEREGITL